MLAVSWRRRAVRISSSSPTYCRSAAIGPLTQNTDDEHLNGGDADNNVDMKFMIQPVSARVLLSTSDGAGIPSPEKGVGS